MNITHALQSLPVSIFLAGPTPRDKAIPSWRPEALDILRQLEFQGRVYVPENEGWSTRDNYDAQIRWEWEAINLATVVAFWVPRHLNTMPAFTTNVEFGLLANSGKTVFGAPTDTPKIGYLLALAEKFHVPVLTTLTETMTAAAAMATDRIQQTRGKP